MPPLPPPHRKICNLRPLRLHFVPNIRVNEEALQFVITLQLALSLLLRFFLVGGGGGIYQGSPLLNEALPCMY